jgi:hypothetical protein
MLPPVTCTLFNVVCSFWGLTSILSLKCCISLIRIFRSLFSFFSFSILLYILLLHLFTDFTLCFLDTILNFICTSFNLLSKFCYLELHSSLVDKHLSQSERNFFERGGDKSSISCGVAGTMSAAGDGHFLFCGTIAGSSSRR